jgi:hypothetical protein
MLGLVSNNGDGGMTRVEIDSALQATLVTQLKENGYQLQLTFQGHTMDEPTDAPEWFDSAITQMVDEDCPAAEVETPWKTHLIVLQHSNSPEFSFYKALQLKPQLPYSSPAGRGSVRHESGNHRPVGGPRYLARSQKDGPYGLERHAKTAR